MIRGMVRQFLHQKLYHALGSLSSSHHCPCSCSRHDGIPGILMTRRGLGSLQVQESQDEPLFLWCGRMCSQKRRNKYPKLQTDHQGEELCKNDLQSYHSDVYLLLSKSDIAGAIPFFHSDDASHEPSLIAGWSIVGASKHVEKTTTWRHHQPV